MRDAQATLALELLFASTLVMAAGQLVQKQRVTAFSIERPLGLRGRGFAHLLVRLVRDPVWLLGRLLRVRGWVRLAYASARKTSHCTRLSHRCVNTLPPACLAKE